MGIVTAVAMQKGGVGKTTTSINLSAGLALGDYSTLLIDLDPQSNATHGLGIEPPGDSRTLYDVLFGNSSLDDVRVPSPVEGLDVVPSSLDLNGARAELPRQQSQYDELRNALHSIQSEYDWILIDCPPSLGPLTMNALRACERLLIPLQCEYYALEGLSQLWNTYERMRDNFNSPIDCLGILLTMSDSRTNLAEDVEKDVRSHFGDTVFDTVIPRNIRISEAPGYGIPVLLHDPTCRGTQAYLNVTQEVIIRERQRTRKGSGRTSAERTTV